MFTAEPHRPDRLDRPDRHDRPRRRVAHLAAILGALAVLAAGCGDPETAAPTTPAGGSDTEIADVVLPANGAPKAGGTLKVGLDAESEGFDPTKNRFAGATYTAARAIFDPLVVLDENLKPQPFLAQSLTPSNNFQTWDIKLRPNVKFHDGTALNAAAAQKSMDKYHKSATGSTVTRPIQSIDVVDDLTVRVQMNEPWSTYPFTLTVQAGMVAASSQIDSPNSASTPVGTGPFKLVSWLPNKSLVVEKNTNYWRPGLPHLGKIEFLPMAENQTRYLSLQAGDIDVMVSPREGTIQDLTRDAKDGKIQLVRAKGDNDVQTLMFNLSKPPFDDIRVRQAVAHAMDRSQVLAITNSPADLAADSLYAKSSQWRAEANYPKYDPEKAKALVQQVEAEKGPLTVKLLAVGDADLLKNVAVYQQLLQQVGIDVAVETTDQAPLISRAISGEYEFMTWRQGGGADPDANYVFWTGKNATGPVALNMPRNQDAQIDAALDAGRRSADPAERKKAYAKIQERMAVDLPYLWIMYLRYTAGVSNRVHNIQGGTLPDGGKTSGMLAGVMPLTEMWVDG